MSSSTKQRGSKSGEIVFNSKDKNGLDWVEFKDKYSQYLDTSAFYIIRTPTTKNDKGNLVKLGISSVGTSEIYRRLSDNEKYYDGDFKVIHLKYVKGTNQTGSPQEKFELEVKRKMREITSPKYGNEWFQSSDLDKIYKVMKQIDSVNKPIEYLAPRRNPESNAKHSMVDSFVKRKYSNHFYVGLIYRIDVEDREYYYSVVYFNRKGKINFDDVDLLDRKEARDGIVLFENWQRQNPSKTEEFKKEWFRVRNEYNLNY